MFKINVTMMVQLLVMVSAFGDDDDFQEIKMILLKNDKCEYLE